MVDRNKLLNHLQELSESQLEELCFRLEVDKFHLRWSGVARKQTAIDLIEYLKQKKQGLQRLQELLESEKSDKDSLPKCPYQGLFAFQEKQAEFFFGRSKFTNDLVQAVGKQPLVAVVGASGSGKSSLVLAGLLPRLRKEGNWLIESFRPEKQPFNQLAAALVHQLEPELGKSDRINKAINLANTIRQHGFTYVLSEILKEHPQKKLLLVVDQFEELYTFCSEEECKCFIDVLLAGIKDSLGLKVVLTLRADFCGQAYSYRPLVDALQSADLKLSSMNELELQEAIEKPAKLKEVQLEDKLTEKLLKDVKQEPGNLPLLQFALTELWKKQRQRTLTHQAYAEIGGVAKALANHAEAVYAKLNPAQQKQAQRIFLQLLHPGEGTEDTRRLATRGEVGKNNWDLVTHLAGSEARLVVTGQNKQTEEQTVEIVHEALLREWQQLRDWIKSDRTFRVWQEELRSRCRHWEQNKENKEDLLTGSFLKVAEVWLNERKADLSPKDQEFIQLSLKLRDRTKRVERNIRFGVATVGLSIVFGALFFVGLPRSATFFYDRGFYKLESGQAKDAIQDFNLALRMQPNLPMVLYSRGKAYEAIKDFDSAIEDHESAMRKGYVPAYIDLARLQITHIKDYTEANKLLEQARPLKKDQATEYSLLKNLGWAQWKLGKYSEADINLRKAISLDEERGSAYCLLAQVLEKMSKAEADKQWKKCLNLGASEHPDENKWIKLAESKITNKKIN
ncbi:MAG: tetratricopeptide repeat protein [Symploca sp. SIO3E6]|nr:tetratricopeptide repeat protein [Caldora sp. SIO3E6]